MKEKIVKTTIFVCLLIIILSVSYLSIEFKKIKKEIEGYNYPTFETPIVSKLKLSAVGDALIHGGVYNASYTNGIYDFKPNIKLVKPLIEDSDVSFYNQESILGGSEIGLSTYPRFNSPYEVGDAMIDAGFNLVSRANNHTLDRGEQAIKNADNYWNNKEDVISYGSSSIPLELSDIPIGQVNGIGYGFLSYTTLTNGLRAPIGKDYFVSVYDEDKVTEDIEYLKDKVDVIIISMHWGSEYTFTPTKEEVDIANYLSSLNVDIIIGHHPHVVQPVTYIDDTLVIYSLGNFISAQRETNKKVGLLVSLEILKIEYNGKTNISIKNIEGNFLYTSTTSDLGKYIVYPFKDLNDSILNNYEGVFEEYSSYVKIDDTIVIKELN